PAIRELRECQHVRQVRKCGGVLFAATATAPPEMIDVQFEPGMALGDLAERRHVAAREEADRQFLALTGGPEPVERAVGPPALLLRLIEGEAEAEHAGPLPPVAHDLLAVCRLQIEMSEDAEFVGVRLDRLDGELVDLLAQSGGRMNDCGIDAG